jgi:hypothetical protein
VAPVRFVVAMLVLVLWGCESKPPAHPFNNLLQRPGVVTLLHPDEIDNRLYAVNYQRMGLIPVCSQVTLLELTTKRLRFRVEATGQTYEYLYHKAASEPFQDHLARYFGYECPPAVQSLSALDKRGLAMGYPPPHVNPSLSSNRRSCWL